MSEIGVKWCDAHEASKWPRGSSVLWKNTFDGIGLDRNYDPDDVFEGLTYCLVQLPRSTQDRAGV